MRCGWWDSETEIFRWKKIRRGESAGVVEVIGSSIEYVCDVVNVNVDGNVHQLPNGVGWGGVFVCCNLLQLLSSICIYSLPLCINFKY